MEDKIGDAVKKLRRNRLGGASGMRAKREEVLYVIFLDLTKAYDALDKSRSLDILEGYRVGPRARRLLRAYWRKYTMVTWVGGYFGTGFKGERGVTQWRTTASTTTLKMVGDSGSPWVTLAVEEAETLGGRGRGGGRNGVQKELVTRGYLGALPPQKSDSSDNTKMPQFLNSVVFTKNTEKLVEKRTCDYGEDVENIIIDSFQYVHVSFYST